jgi:twitching motility protein PilT
MRDNETMATAITAAETGHLVLASLHTNSASQTIDRIIDSFAPEQQHQIRAQLADTLIGVISRRLLPGISGELVPAAEVLFSNTAVRTLIRDQKTHQINMVIETSADEGMVTLNRSLADLVQRGEITLQTAEFYSLDREELHALLKQGEPA